MKLVRRSSRIRRWFWEQKKTGKKSRVARFEWDEKFCDLWTAASSSSVCWAQQQQQQHEVEGGGRISFEEWPTTNKLMKFLLKLRYDFPSLRLFRNFFSSCCCCWASVEWNRMKENDRQNSLLSLLFTDFYSILISPYLSSLPTLLLSLIFMSFTTFAFRILKQVSLRTNSSLAWDGKAWVVHNKL